MFGLNTHIASRHADFYSMATPAQVLLDTDIGWAREDFQFHRIVAGPGNYNWDWHDEMVNQLQQQGVKIVGLLNGPTPAWARPAGSADFHPPDPQAFAEFAAAAAARYQGRIDYWQIWNEPDNIAYWSSGPDPVAYANLLKAAYPAIKGANPNARVLAAGIVSPEPALSYYQAFADSGAWNSFDIIALHPYADPMSPEQGQIGSMGIGAVKALADRYGAKPIWATEFGWSTRPGDRGGNMVSEEMQANYLIRGATMIANAGADRVIWYNFKDLNPNDGLGLLRYGSGPSDYGQLKPSFLAFRTLNQQLAGASPAGMIDLAQAANLFDFEQFGTWHRGDEPNGSFTQTSAQVHSGRFAGQLSYNFPSGDNDYVVFNAGRPLPLNGNPPRLGMWVYGDSSGHLLNVWLRDAQGEVLQYRLGPIGSAGWNMLSTNINGPVESWNRISGSGDGRLTYPASLVALVLDDQPDHRPSSGTIYLDDLTGLVGPEAYGSRFRKGGQVVDVLWAPQVTEITVPTNSSQGTRVEVWGEQKTEVAGNGQFRFAVGPNPIFLTHTPGQAQPQPQPRPQPQPPQPRPPEPGPVTPPSDDARCFEQTGFCISGRIREYWEQNGGLMVFGYPISPQRAETIEGQNLQVQWFERNRLELHPANPRPYDVLLGRLSSDLLNYQNRDWQQFPQTGNQSGCRFFAETGQSVCGEILAAWRANGLELDGRPGKTADENLALFGLPISPPQTETLSDGRQYTVQWFERARFELHPENPAPHNVLLGLLGNEVMQAHNGQ
jgi:hypothetical protein